MDTKTLFLQLKNFILSNNKILDILNDNIAQEDWKEDIFYAVSNDDIFDWKNDIGYKEICKELHQKGNKKLINDKDEEWCCRIIENNIKGKKLNKKKFTNSTIYSSLYLKINYSNLSDSKKYISPNTYFYLISREIWELFGLNENKEYSGKIPIITGKNKILIKFESNKIILLSLIDNKEVDPLYLEKYLIQYIINLENLQENEMNEFVEKIKNMDLKDFDKKNEYLLIDNKKLSFQTKNALDISFNLDINSIVKNSQIDKENKEALDKLINSLDKKQSIKEVNYICKSIVRKIRYCTYIISSMYSLSQIPEFTDYFFCNENNLLFESKLLFYFKHYIDNLWMNAGEETIFEPTLFIHYLNRINKDIFDIKEEKLPIVFLEKMFDYINEELNNKDFKITKQLKETNEEFLNKYNSIVAKVFYGIFKQRNICISCGEAKNNSLENDIFKYININKTKYSNEESKLDNSLTFFYLDDLIEFYFTKQRNTDFCENCKERKEFKIINKEIYKFPDILVINIDWGEFDEQKGFGLEENELIFDKIIDLTKYAHIKQNEIKYEIRSVINYPVVNEKIDKSWKKYITFSKHLVNQRFYCYQPGGKVIEFNSINRRRFVPSVFFYERIKLK